MDIVYNLFFFAIAFILIIAALGVVFLPRIVYSAVSMITAFLAVAGIFVLLNADFVAISQVVIYAVGITIVMIFAIMFTESATEKQIYIAFAPRTLLALGASGAFFIAVLAAATNGFGLITKGSGTFLSTLPSIETIGTLQEEGTTGIIGNLLLTKYVLPFEVLSLLLLAALLGSVVIAKKNRDNLLNPTTKSVEDN
jgi:NADH:ubiquinone oxidoreductase subunit 6 (subunit J)